MHLHPWVGSVELTNAELAVHRVQVEAVQVPQSVAVQGWQIPPVPKKYPEAQVHVPVVGLKTRFREESQITHLGGTLE